MPNTNFLGAALLALISGPALAQHDHAQLDHAVPADTTQTAFGPIRALSPEDVAGLREGRGMGLALAAELNGYPGPLHVLELADSLDLTGNQRHTTQRLRAEMSVHARSLGEQILAREAALDALFAGGRAAPAQVDALTSEIGALQGRLRAAHLRAHVAMRAALTDTQVALYDRLRGHTER